MKEDDVFRGVRAAVESVPEAHLHPRVLETSDQDGFALWVVFWGDPGPSAAATLKRTIEAALLAELSRPASELRDAPGRRLRSVRLATFEQIAAIRDVAPLLALHEDDIDDDAWRTAIARIRGEASVLGRPVPETAATRWRSPAEMNARATLLLDLESAMARALAGRVFGEQPGEMFACLNAALEHHGLAALPPRIASIDALEALLGGTPERCLRWIPPLLFQALCDAIAVVASVDLGREVEWGICQVDDEDGLAPPPLIRVPESGAWVHVPLGLHVLRWCVMPLQPGERPVALSAWAVDQFGAR